MYESAHIPDTDTAIFRFRINCQEINCIIDKKEGKIVEGAEDYVESCVYFIDVTRNPEPVIEEVGHPYYIIGMERTGVIKQIL